MRNQYPELPAWLVQAASSSCDRFLRFWKFTHVLFKLRAPGPPLNIDQLQRFFAHSVFFIIGIDWKAATRLFCTFIFKGHPNAHTHAHAQSRVPFSQIRICSRTHTLRQTMKTCSRLKRQSKPVAQKTSGSCLRRDEGNEGINEQILR